jgi:hypothetical protein
LSYCIFQAKAWTWRRKEGNESESHAFKMADRKLPSGKGNNGSEQNLNREKYSY